ncbi:MAG: FkbM family methyltransferase [Lewinellaceae bacterium]|nr:FkbM family methyltransferase [Lewinellaceae bacterium]
MISKLKKTLLLFLNFFRFEKSYSQDGEDVVLLSFFEGQKKYKGFFVDVGAHHPVRFSNTWLFYKKGWRGINIDPTPGSMRSFRFMRRKDTNLEIGIGMEEIELDFYCFNEPALNTFDKNLALERNNKGPYRILKTLKVHIKSLKTILDEHLPLNAKIDFMTIDVEGLDLSVLQSNDWLKYRPTYLLVEDIGFEYESRENSDIYCFLKNKGYTIAASLKRTTIYRLVH